jgi:hypothetical protein
MLAASGADPATGDPHGVRLIDWELVAAGDPAWDVATLLQAALVRTCLVQAQARALEPSDLRPHRDALQALVRAWATACGCTTRTARPRRSGSAHTSTSSGLNALRPHVLTRRRVLPDVGEERLVEGAMRLLHLCALRSRPSSSPGSGGSRSGSGRSS